MFDVTIYTKDGRKMYDHVAQITNLTNDNIVLDFITDFGDHLNKTIKAQEIEYITVRCING